MSWLIKSSRPCIQTSYDDVMLGEREFSGGKEIHDFLCVLCVSREWRLVWFGFLWSLKRILLSPLAWDSSSTWEQYQLMMGAYYSFPPFPTIQFFFFFWGSNSIPFWVFFIFVFWVVGFVLKVERDNPFFFLSFLEILTRVFGDWFCFRWLPFRLESILKGRDWFREFLLFLCW